MSPVRNLRGAGWIATQEFHISVAILAETPIALQLCFPKIVAKCPIPASWRSLCYSAFLILALDVSKSSARVIPSSEAS